MDPNWLRPGGVLPKAAPTLTFPPERARTERRYQHDDRGASDALLQLHDPPVDPAFGRMVLHAERSIAEATINAGFAVDRFD